MATAMKTSLDYRNDFLCVLAESEAPDSRLIREWYPVRESCQAEVQILCGRPVTKISSSEAIFLDEDGNVFQLLNKGETKPIEVEHSPGTGKTELEVLMEASLKGGQANGKNSGAKRLLKKIRSSSRKRQASPGRPRSTDPCRACCS